MIAHDMPPALITGQVPAIARETARRGWPHRFDINEVRGLGSKVAAASGLPAKGRTSRCQLTPNGRRFTACSVTRVSGRVAVTVAYRIEVVYEDGAFKAQRTVIISGISR